MTSCWKAGEAGWNEWQQPGALPGSQPLWKCPKQTGIGHPQWIVGPRSVTPNFVAMSQTNSMTGQDALITSKDEY